MDGNKTPTLEGTLTHQAAALVALAAVAPAAVATGTLGRTAAVVLAAVAAAAAAAEAGGALALHRRAVAPASAAYRRGLARAIRRDIALERACVRNRPPVARILAEDADAAERIARRLERSRLDPNVVAEVRRLLEDGRPSRDRLRRIAFLVERDA